ncbi:MAG: flippase [Methyloprofundus sp.]|nr:flippase [Methyloprofundus sp.]
MAPPLPAWSRYVPAILLEKLHNRPNLQKAVTNTGWLFADHIVRIGVGLLVSVWVARYLGPEQFGLFNYAISFVTLFGAIATLGLNGIVLRDLVKEPETAGVTLGTTFVLQFIGGLVGFGLAVGVIGYVRPGDALSQLIVVVLGSVMLFKPTETVRYWFESQVQSKYIIWVENFVFLIIAALKVILILNHASLMAFVWLVLAEATLVAIALISVYMWRGGDFHHWQIKSERAKSLLKDSWPLILSGLAITAYMRIDQIMLGQMLGDESVGIYSAAVRISEAWYFIPLAIIASVFPSIIEAQKQSLILYSQRLQQLFDLTIILAFLVAVPMTFLSTSLVTLLFGQSYEEAGSVLAIHIWTGIFVVLSHTSGRWLINEGYTLFALKRNLIGVIINVILNIYIIPIYGANGAAIATLFSYFVASYALDFASKETRLIFFQKSRAIFMLNTIKLLFRDRNLS